MRAYSNSTIFWNRTRVKVNFRSPPSFLPAKCLDLAVMRMNSRMEKFCLPPFDRAKWVEEVRLRDLNVLTAEERVRILRAMRNANPELKKLTRCMEKSGKRFYLGECKAEQPSGILSDCECTESSGISSFCNLFRSKRCYSETELECFEKVVQQHLDGEMGRRGICCKRNLDKRPSRYFIVPVIVCSNREECCSISSEEGSETQYCVCEPQSLTCSEIKFLETECRVRGRPIEFRHFGHLLRVDSIELEPPTEPFALGYVGRSEEISKWGEFLDMVELVLLKRDLVVSLMVTQSCHELGGGLVPQVRTTAVNQTMACCNDVCTMPVKIRRDRFSVLDRFQGVEIFGMSIFCRRLIYWTNCITKRWSCLTNHRHVVIHLPSMGFPCNIRCKAQDNFQALQNIQIGRIGWLVNENADVLYVCPGRSNFETSCILRHFTSLARPDVSLSRLWIVENDENCLCKDVEEEYRSGCENLFYTPSVYRRVRHLSAGRQSFIIAGVLCKINVFIACELRTSIIGPCMKFQNRLLNKYYVMSLLAESRIRHPPFAGVRSFKRLCAKLATLTVKTRTHRWLIKINNGFCGNQSALVSLYPEECCMRKDELSLHLGNALPHRLKLNKGAYKDIKDFLVELERHGGVLMACAPGDCRTVSLGCFIEHDTADACLRTSADVVRRRGPKGYSWLDVGYIIPQTSLPEEVVHKLVAALGKVLLMEQYLGFYGVDLVVFNDPEMDGALNYWVIDVDPYYTDLLSFDDWRRFCLNIPNNASFSTKPTFLDCNDAFRMYSRDNRFVVCSGKLYIDGLSCISLVYLDELFRRHGIAYSAKARTGCMICPLNNEKRAFLLFAFCCDRIRAVEYFVHALEAVHQAARAMNKGKVRDNSMIHLAKDMKETYGLIPARRR